MTKKINEPTRIIGTDDEGKPIELPRAPSTNLFDLDPEGIPEETMPLGLAQRVPVLHAPTEHMPGAYKEKLEPLSDAEPTPAPREIAEHEDEPLSLGEELVPQDPAKIARAKLEGISPQGVDEIITVEGDEPLEPYDAPNIQDGDIKFVPDELAVPPVQKERTPTPTELRQKAEDAYVMEASHLAYQHFIPLAIVDEFQAPSAQQQLLESLSALDQGRTHEVKQLAHNGMVEIWIKVNPEKTT